MKDAMKSRSIAVVEPQMENLFHASFNAALLHSVVLAYPDESISFRALPGHAQAVRDVLQQHAPEIVEAIEWRPIAPAARTSIFARWRANNRLLNEVLAPKERVLFCSISRMQLLQLKRIMRTGDEARAVLHGDLDRITEPITERFPASLFALQNVLLKPQPSGLRFVVLSESIRQNMPPEYEPAMRNAGVIDIPYHFGPIQPTPAEPVVFGLFGNTGDGHLQEEVARSVKSANANILFRLVGFLSNDEAVARLSPYVDLVGRTPIDHDEFVRRAESVTHTLWLAHPGGFRLRASATFFDALGYGKPLVYTANAFVDPYFAEAPGIGVRCDSVAEVPEAILRLAAETTPESYAATQAAIAEFRIRFTPKALAKRLPKALGWD
jgi:hypothetical protein